MAPARMVGSLLALFWAASSLPCSAQDVSIADLKRAGFLLDAAADAAAHGGIDMDSWQDYDLSAPLFGHDEPSSAPSQPESRVERRLNSLLEVDLGSTSLLFRDVERDSWYAPYIRAAAEQGILQGYRDAPDSSSAEYRPERSVSVEELAKVALVASGGAPACSNDAIARNTSASGSWSLSFIACAESLRWPLYADASVDVRRPATRAEVVLTMLRAFDVQTAVAEAGTPPLFKDVPPSLLAAQVIERAAQDGIVSGYAKPDGAPTGYFGPDDPVSRAQLAKILVLSIERYGS